MRQTYEQRILWLWHALQHMIFFFSICNHKFATTTTGWAIIMSPMHPASHAYDMKSISFCVYSSVLVCSCLSAVLVQTTCGMCSYFVQLHRVKGSIFFWYVPAQRFLIKYSIRRRYMGGYSLFIFV